MLRRPTYLHQLFVVQSSRCIQHWQTVSCPNQIFLLQLKPRNRMYLVDQLPCGSVLTPAISCTKFQIHSAHADSPMPKTDFFFLQFLERTSLYFTDQGTQKENELGGPTPPWVSTYTSHLLYKIPNPFYSGAPADTPKAKTGSGTVINGLQTAKLVIISEHGGPGKLIV